MKNVRSSESKAQNIHLFASFNHDRWIIANTDLWIEDRTWGTFTNPEDARMIALDKSSWIWIVREVVTTVDTAWILN